MADLVGGVLSVPISNPLAIDLACKLMEVSKPMEREIVGTNLDLFEYPGHVIYAPCDAAGDRVESNYKSDVKGRVTDRMGLFELVEQDFECDGRI